MSVQLSHVTFVWPAAEAAPSSRALPSEGPFPAPVDLVLEPGWTAVLGANGAGKTTLLRLVAGQLAPASGRVRAPAGVHLCPQQVEDLDAAVEDLAWSWDGLACRLRGRLQLEPEELARWPTLSPGERKRWQIGAALAAEPPVLLLDEPTNHLDDPGRALLLEVLGRYRGVGVVVSHDRAFLDALASRSVIVEGGAVRAVPLPPTEALADRARQHQAQLDALDAAAAEARASRLALADARRVHDEALRGTQTRRRMKGPRDHDGRSMGAKFRAATAERRRARQVAVARGRAERTEAALRTVDRPTELGRSVFVRYEPSPKSPVLELACPAVHAGDQLVLRDVSLALPRDGHVHLAGPNGAGKSTLVRALLAASSLPPDRLLHLPQELGEADATRWLARLRALPSDERGRVLQVVAALGVDPTALLASACPSPGEARKLAIAFGLAHHAWLVVLDEPTNHLDLPSIERLEGALAAWPGALLLVTHDEALARRCCTERWRIADGRVAREAIAEV